MSAVPTPEVPAAGQAGTQRHTAIDDTQGLLTGTLMVALGLMLFRAAGLMTGGLAGIALTLHYATGWSFGALLFGMNLPFYVVAGRRLGLRFTLKTLEKAAKALGAELIVDLRRSPARKPAI